MNGPTVATGGGEGAEAMPRGCKFLYRFGAGEDLSAMSQSPDTTSQQIVVAGRSPLRILTVDPSADGKGFTSVQNLRTRRRSGLNYSVVDVVWNPNDADMIATAATNGVIVLWKNFQPETETIMKDHLRSVNRLDWHPSNPALLLSASQDGTMRLWDIRSRSVGTGTPNKIFEPCSDSVRDASFSPFHHNYIAAGFDNGTLQLWDMRKEAKYWRKITAHNGLVHSVAFHRSFSNLVATGGRDRMINVWDLKQIVDKPAHSIQALSSIATVSWRPNFPSQLMTTSSVVDGNIYVWNYKKPNVPYLIVGGHSDVVTALISYPKGDSSAIVSCSKDSTVQYHTLDQAVRPWHTLHSSAISWNVYNHVAMNNDIIDRKALYREFTDKPTAHIHAKPAPADLFPAVATPSISSAPPPPPPPPPPPSSSFSSSSSSSVALTAPPTPSIASLTPSTPLPPSHCFWCFGAIHVAYDRINLLDFSCSACYSDRRANPVLARLFVPFDSSGY